MLIGIALTERIKPSAYFVTSAVCAVVSSLLSWLTWGSTGPLTNEGYHDFFGAGFVYVFAGSVALVMVRARRHRAWACTGRTRAPASTGPTTSGLTTIGLVMIIGGLPFVILSCGFFFAPEALFVGVNMSDTSIGVAFNNLGLSWAGGAIAGALIAYRTKKYIYTLLGPFAGYVIGTPGFDIYAPWEMLLDLDGGALRRLCDLRVAAEARDRRAQADPAVRRGRLRGHPRWSASSTGARRSGGYFGVTEGDYAFQHAEVNLLWQAIGLAVCLGAGLATGAVLVAVLEADDWPRRRRGGRGRRGSTPPTGRSSTISTRRRAQVAVVEQAAAPPAGPGNGDAAPAERGPTTV